MRSSFATPTGLLVLGAMLVVSPRPASARSERQFKWKEGKAMCVAFMEGNAVELFTLLRTGPASGDTFDVAGRQITIGGQPVQNPLLGR